MISKDKFKYGKAVVEFLLLKHKNIIQVYPGKRCKRYKNIITYFGVTITFYWKLFAQK